MEGQLQFIRSDFHRRLIVCFTTSYYFVHANKNYIRCSESLSMDGCTLVLVPKGAIEKC